MGKRAFATRAELSRDRWRELACEESRALEGELQRSAERASIAERARAGENLVSALTHLLHTVTLTAAAKHVAHRAIQEWNNSK